MLQYVCIAEVNFVLVFLSILEIQEQILLDAHNKQEVEFIKSHLRKEQSKNSEQEQIIDTLIKNKDAINRDDVSTSKKGGIELIH